MFFELVADTGAKERGPELGLSLMKFLPGRFWSHVSAFGPGFLNILGKLKIEIPLLI